MLRRITIQILALSIAMLIVVFSIGSLLTAPASTAVEALSADFPVKPVAIPAASQSAVRGWLAYGKSGNGVVLLVHSMRSNRLEMMSRARFLQNLGYSVLFIDLQAHGETAGDKITFGLQEAKNVETSIAYLRQIFPGERLAAIGTSLGAAAIVLAKKDLRLDAVILESLHPTVEEAIDNRLKLHFGEYGSLLLPLMLWQLSFNLNASLDELSPIRHINNLAAPVLFIAGTHDAHTTQSETERLYAAARSPKELWIVPGARHFNMHAYAGRAYEQQVADFLAQHMRKNENN